MASSTTASVQGDQCLPGRTFPEYFTQIAAGYSRSTGNSTYKVIQEFLRTTPTPVINAASIINDNACGPGIATAAVVAHLGGEPARIEATDSVPAMVDAVQHRIQGRGWKNVNAVQLDSHSLTFPDNTFTTSISNINISTYTDPLKCLQEIHRTLKPDGIIVASIWKRFGAVDVIHRAQQLIDQDSDLIKVPKAEFMQDGYLRDMVAQAGFKGVKQHAVRVVCTKGDLDGLRGFVLGDFTKTAREKYTETDQTRWPEVVERAILEEVQNYGGILFEAWFITGTKEIPESHGRT